MEVQTSSWRCLNNDLLRMSKSAQALRGKVKSVAKRLMELTG